MSHHLKPAELELLAMISEECGEIVQEIGKIMRFGLDEYHPRDPSKTTNRERLAIELGDLMGVGVLASAAGLINPDKVILARDAKIDRVQKWLRQQ